MKPGLLLVALATLGRTGVLLLVAAFAGLVGCILAKTFDLTTFVTCVTLGAPHCLMLLMVKGYIAILSLEHDGVGAKSSHGTEQEHGNSSKHLFHLDFTSFTYSNTELKSK
jgi:hypothetical protein